MEVSQAEYLYITEGFKKLIPEFVEKHQVGAPPHDAKRAQAIIEQNDAEILREYAMAGLKPVITGFNRPMSLYLARMMRLPIEPIEAEEAA
ncbi:hypothetical protein [Tardiphaga sp.]|jgi:hypothetical protein|uniref:hypothetical protein n=1 Tax=Tardiphaga sp. TaxID=1926292 RepID=UPI0037DA34F5